MRAPAIGLTGGIASGKSLAAQTFIELGVPLLEADLVAREVVAPGTAALARIKAEFGSEYLLGDGNLDRARLRRRVFADPAELKRLEQITHPAIRRRLTEWRDAQTAPYCVLSVPILIESGMDALVDRVLVIDTPVEAQLQRLLVRDKVSDTLARQMLAAQASREQRLARADDVIVNSGTPEELRRAIRALHARYLTLPQVAAV